MSLSLSKPTVSHSVPSLQTDVIFDILSELLVKFVTSFKCVSAHLRNGIHKMPPEVCRSQEEYLCLLRFLSLYPSDDKNPFGSKNKLLTVDLKCSTLKQTLTQNPRSESVKLIGSCDGLICLLCRPDNFFLLNPAPIILF